MLAVKAGLVVTVDADGLRIEHPAWDYAVRASPTIVDLLYRARTPVRREALVSAAPGTADSVDRLVELDLLEEASPDDASRARGLPAPWNYWGSSTWLFHARAHRTQFLHDKSEIWLEKVGREEPPPERARRHPADAPEVDLTPHRGRSPLAEVFAHRRTTREFARRPLPLARLGELVSETFRVREVVDADYFGMLPRKSYPSSGGRHEIDVYVVALEVTGLARGVHVYDDARDTLVDTSLRVETDVLDAALAHQGMATTSAAVLVAVCAAERLAWKYRSPRGYLDAYVNVGHAMQNAVLYAASLDIAAWLSTALDTAALSGLLHLADDEFPLAALALGAPPGSDGPPSP